MRAASSGANLAPSREGPVLTRFITRVAIGALGLWLADQVISGVRFTDGWSLVIAALLLGVVNAIVRPVVVILTLPLTIVTLGLFLLVVNAAMIGLVAMLLSGFQVSGLAAGVSAAIVTGVVSWIGAMVLKDAPAR